MGFAWRFARPEEELWGEVGNAVSEEDLKRRIRDNAGHYAQCAEFGRDGCVPGSAAVDPIQGTDLFVTSELASASVSGE